MMGFDVGTVMMAVLAFLAVVGPSVKDWVAKDSGKHPMLDVLLPAIVDAAKQGKLDPGHPLLSLLQGALAAKK